MSLRTGSAIGEISEEFAQEIASIHQSDNEDFYAELDSRFGTLEKATKFVVSVGIMGFVIGGGNAAVKSSRESFKKYYAE